MKKKCGECDALNYIGLMVDGKMFFGDIEALQKLVNKTIAMAKLEAVEEYISLYDDWSNGTQTDASIQKEHDYLAELHKAARKGER